MRLSRTEPDSQAMKINQRQLIRLRSVAMRHCCDSRYVDGRDAIEIDKGPVHVSVYINNLLEKVYLDEWLF